jgi:hypothetical protein
MIDTNSEAFNAGVAAFRANAAHDTTLHDSLKAFLIEYEAARPNEITMLNVLADIRMSTGLREKPMLSELAGEIGKLLAANKTAKLVFHSRDAKPLNTAIETTRESVPSIMAWYGECWSGDPYTVTFDGRNVPMDENGGPVDWKEGE